MVRTEHCILVGLVLLFLILTVYFLLCECSQTLTVVASDGG